MQTVRTSVDGAFGQHGQFGLKCLFPYGTTVSLEKEILYYLNGEKLPSVEVQGDATV